MTKVFQEYLSKRDQATDRWMHYVNKYSLCYNEAWLSFHDALEKQQKADLERAEKVAAFAMIVLSVCSGSVRRLSSAPRS